ncbi:hypothetical protein FB107DRAFT_225332 [Schizophyllum commune]
MSSLPALVELEGRIIRLYRLIELESTSPIERLRIRRQLSTLATQPDLFQYLLRDPAEMDEEQWRPMSPTVSAVTACFLAMNAITTTSDASPVLSSFDMLQNCECASTFLPRAMKWIPFLNPAYGTLPYHPTHHPILVNSLHAMYHYGRCIVSFQDQNATLCGYIASLWSFHIVHADCDSPDGAAQRPSEALASCVIDMLRPKGSVVFPDIPNMMVVAAVVRAELLRAMQQSPRRIFVRLLLFAFTLLSRARAAPNPDFSILGMHIRIIELLMRVVFPNIRHSRKTVKLAVGVIRMAPCPDVAEAGCDLLLSICDAASGNYPLRWALRCGIVGALRRIRHMGVARNACLTVFRYIAIRTTSRSLLEVLSVQEAPSGLLGRDLTDNSSLALEFDRILRGRMEVFRMTGNKAQCAMSPKAHWEEHKSHCLWRLNNLLGRGTSSTDAGYAMLQVISYMLSDRGWSLLQALLHAEEENRMHGVARELVVEISLDRFPPVHTMVTEESTRSFPEEPILILRANMFLRGLTAVSLQPESLRTFLATVRAVSSLS